jgi:hypothetical protein
MFGWNLKGREWRLFTKDSAPIEIETFFLFHQMGLTIQELEMIESNQTTECWFGFRDLDQNDVHQLSLSLAKNHSLKKLNLNGNSITSIGLASILTALDGNSNLIELNVAGNSIDDDGCLSLVWFLARNKSLTCLCLLGNSITDFGAIQLSTVLPHLHLTSLYLYMNLIRDKGAIAIAAALTKNSSIETLWLDHNLISLRGTQEVVQNLLNNRSLTALELTVHHDLMGREDREIMYHRLEKNKELQKKRTDAAHVLLQCCRKWGLLISSSSTQLPHEIIFYILTINNTVFSQIELIKMVEYLLQRRSIGKLIFDLPFSGSELVRQCTLLQ